jgi:hypothetical protein
MKTKAINIKRKDSAWFEVTGECMSPLIRKKDLVLSVPAVKIVIGDIVVIPGPTPAVHRVVKISSNDHLLTKGDNSLCLDSPVTRQDLTGKVIAIVKKENKPIYIEGKSWKIKNYLMAKYSLTCYTVWRLVSYNSFIRNTYKRISNPLKNIHNFIAGTLTHFNTVKK